MKAIGYEDYQGPRLTRQQQIARMHRVIENELTEKQKRAVLGYYVDRKTPAQMFAVLTEILHAFRNVRRGRCPHRPKGSYEFAEDFQKNGAFCRGDVGIAPYA